MRLLRIILATLTLNVGLVCNAQIKINEVMPCNISTIMEKDGFNFSGYIEFSNSSSKDVNLKGYTLVHYKKGSNKYSEKWSWNVDSDFTVKASKYKLLWADETENINHVPYKLDTDGGYLLLKKGTTLIDSFAYEKQTAHISYGLYGSTAGYMIPSPGAKNTTAYEKASRCAKPVFSENGGLKTAKFDITLSSSTKGAAIYYTTDGSEPSKNSTRYTGAISIRQNTNIRAIAYADGMLPSQIETNSYIYQEHEHTTCGGMNLPIVSITIDKNYLYDDSIGIYVVGKNGIPGEKRCISTKANYNQDWKRPLNFEYFVDGKRVLSQEVEAAVEGGCSRSNSVKSLSLKASKRTGNSELGYNFFNVRPDITHQTVYVRNGGTANTYVKFRDGLIHTMAIPMNIDYQAYQPIVYYINGKYTGLQALMERANADYIKANYGIDEEDIDFINISDVFGPVASKGSLDAYNELVEFLQKGDNKSEAYYEEACKRMDMDEYIDYQILEQFIVNVDWPGNNAKLWREKKDGSRFRWIAFDMDYGLGIQNGTTFAAYDMNFIKWCRGEGKTAWGNNQPWMVTIFKNLSDNPQFKKKFTTKFLIHLSTTFSDDRINAVVDSVANLVEHEYCVDMRGASSLDDAEHMRKFALQRKPYIYQHLYEYMGTSKAAEFILKSNVEGAHFTINGEHVTGLYGRYLCGFESEFKAYPPAGYKFDHWNIKGTFDQSGITENCTNNLPGVLSGKMTGSCVITAVFTEAKTNNTLVINELCASSDEKSGNADEYGKYPDWIEVYNYGSEPVDMAGYFFSNKKSDLKLSQIAYGSENTQVKSKEHKILWANSDPVDGELHLNFSMNVDKPKTIYLSDQKGNMISNGAYEMHATNESFGNSTDNSGNWVKFEICDKATATPGSKNGSIDCNGSDGIVQVAADAVAIYPNPAVSDVEVSASSIIHEIDIYDINGRLLQHYTPNDAKYTMDVSAIGRDILVVRVVCEDGVYVKKLLK